MRDPEYRRLYAIEGLVTDAAELVARLMEKQGVNKAELARRLGKTRAWVTQLLSGRANMTMRTFAEVVYALNAEVKLSAEEQMSQREQSALVQRWAARFKVPLTDDVLRKAEIRFAFSDLTPSVWGRHDQAELLERPEYAA